MYPDVLKEVLQMILNSTKISKSALLVFLLIMVSFPRSYAHNPSETFTSISFVQDNLQVTIEVPWTIADAIRKEFEVESTSKEKFLDLAQEYLKQNFKIQSGNSLLVANNIEIIELDDGHSALYKVDYTASTLEDLKVVNTLLFNIQSEQRNYHKINYPDGRSKSFVTTVDQNHFSTEDSETDAGKGSVWKWIVAGIALLLITYLLYKRIARTH